MNALVVTTTVTTPEQAAALAGLAAPAGEVHLVRLERTWSAATQAAAVVTAAREAGADVLVLASSHPAKEVAALAAHALGAGLLVDVHALHRDGDALVGSKRELGGTWDVTCAATGPVVVLAKPGPAAADAPVPAVTDLPQPTGEDAPRRDVQVLSRTPHTGDAGPSLADARTVVAGGRGLEGDLGPVRELAAVLGAAVGATRDIVEEGWIGHEAMVGQTGTMVAPRLYIGAGLSGAPHHRLGMQAAEVVVAINSDPDAPIMEIADVAVVGDAATVLTQTAAALRERLGR